MTDQMEEFDPVEVAEAEQLDRAIDAAPADSAVATLVSAFRAEPPPQLSARVRRALAEGSRRAWRPVQISAAALAALLAFHGLGNLFNGEWISENLNEPYGAHGFIEGGGAFLALAIAVGAGALRRQWSGVAVAAGAPIGIFLGVQGVSEIGEFAAGAALHLTQGAIGLALLASWWRFRRYASVPNDE